VSDRAGPSLDVRQYGARLYRFISRHFPRGKSLSLSDFYLNEISQSGAFYYQAQCLPDAIIIGKGNACSSKLGRKIG